MARTRRTFFQAAALAGAGAGALTLPAQQHTGEVLDSEQFRRAVIAGDTAQVKTMIDKDQALVYGRDATGLSVYVLACLANQTAIADLLRERGLVMDIFEAAAGGHSDRVTELVNQNLGLIHARVPDGRTALHLATKAGKPAVVLLLTGRGADIAGGPESPLLAAVDYPEAATAFEMTISLANNASNPNARRNDGTTPLHLAAARGHGDVVRLLIHRGADPSLKDAKGRSPIDVATGEAAAVLRGADKIERVYFGARFQRDAKGNAVNLPAASPVPQDWVNQFVTLAHFNQEKVKELLSACPTLVLAKSTFDEMAVEASAHVGLVPLAKYLSDAGAPVSICTAAVLGWKDAVVTMLREDRNRIRERGPHDIPLLQYTAWGNGQVEIAAWLLDQGADIEVRGLGQTTLHIAARRGHIELARLLLDRGADINAPTQSRVAPGTPLALAVKSKQDRMADFLRSRGATM